MKTPEQLKGAIRNIAVEKKTAFTGSSTNVHV